MRTIIAGTRTITDPQRLLDALAQCGWVPTTVLCGCAQGVDRLGFEWARQRETTVEFFPAWQNQADWALIHARAFENVRWPNTKLPKNRSDGFVRNSIMAQNAQALIALWDGTSLGTKHMIETATRRGLKVYAHIVKDYESQLREPSLNEFERLYKNKWVAKKP